ncbi:hypothetical protein [Streptomyces sp. NPDC058572]|uniref:hypothetical protein n=1 Tax=Streptomyces sp. NPDC058572 TaxID=3346546 RepID=UPI00365DBCD3
MRRWCGRDSAFRGADVINARRPLGTRFSATAPVQARLRERDLAPGQHHLDSGHPSTALIHAAARHGTAMITPASGRSAPRPRGTM